MYNTKHDLSYTEAKLDFQALVKTAEIAYVKAREEVSRRLHGLYEIELTKDNTGRYCEANRLKETAQHLAIAAETLSVLYEARTRKILKVINKSE